MIRSEWPELEAKTVAMSPSSQLFALKSHSRACHVNRSFHGCRRVMIIFRSLSSDIAGNRESFGKLVALLIRWHLVCGYHLFGISLAQLNYIYFGGGSS